jgi:hypothetical protein
MARLCDLRSLAALIYERYGTGHPIATVRVTNSPIPNTYLVLLQGVEGKHIDTWQALQGYLRKAGPAELRIVENFLRLGQGDRYRQAILEAVNQLPPRSTLLLAGHSLGGIEAQNLVEEFTRRGFQVTNVFSFGAPVTGERATGPRYLDIKAIRGAVPDLIALPALDRGISLNIVQIHGGTSLDLWDTEHGSHHIYNKSAELAALSLDGGKPRRADGGPCLELDIDSLEEYKMDLERWPPCPDVSYRGVQPRHMTNQWSTQQTAQTAWTNRWQQATTLQERKHISESIGEAAMTFEARAHGYQTLLSPGTASGTPQGFDAVYYDRSTDTYVIAEAKGGYVGKGLDYILGSGYRCRQGTLDWVWRAAEQILTSGTTNSKEQQVAQQIMNRLRVNQEGGRASVRVEVFHTAHTRGMPGVTKHYVTASVP